MVVEINSSMFASDCYSAHALVVIVPVKVAGAF